MFKVDAICDASTATTATFKVSTGSKTVKKQVGSKANANLAENLNCAFHISELCDPVQIFFHVRL